MVAGDRAYLGLWDSGMVILDNGKKVPFCIGCGGESSAIGAKLVGTGITWTQPKSRVYWNIQQ